MKAPEPTNEQERLKALRDFEILDTAPEKSFDDITLLAAQLCETPIALITLLDEKRQWFKSRVGMEILETPRDVAFCTHTVLQKDVLVVEDVRTDERFAANPFVTGEPGIRFYAGAPLITSDGLALGALCVIDREPRHITEEQKKALLVLSQQVVSQLELRRTLRIKAESEERLRASELSYRRLFEAAQDGILILEIDSGQVVDANPFLCELLGFSKEEIVGKTVGEISPFADVISNQTMLERLQTDGYVRYEDLPLETKDGRYIAVEFVSNVYEAGDKKVAQCNIRDITERKKTEQRLALMSQCIANLNDAVMITEAEPLSEPGPKIVFVNEAFERITGYTPAEAMGKSPRFLQGPKTERRILDEIREALVNREPIKKHVVNYRKDGSEYWVDIDLVPVLNAVGKCTHFAAIERDITESKKLKESLKLFRTLMERSADAIEIIDPETGRFLDVNQTAHERLGYSRAEMLAMRFPDIVADEGGPVSIRESAEEVQKTGYRIRESRHRRKDGSTFPIEISVQHIDLDRGYMVAIVRDITDRKRNEARFRRLVESNAQGVIFWNVRGKITDANDAFLNLVGFTRHELEAGLLSWTAMTPPEFAEVDRICLEKVAMTGFCAPFEKAYVRKDGSRVPVIVGVSTFEDCPEEGVCFVVDLTERKKLEQQFFRAQRMESIGTLAGGIAHDLNNILAPILMSIDLLKSTATDAQAMAILETIEVSAKRGADIVRQVLTFARGIEGERIEIQVKHLLDDIKVIIKDTFPKDVRLQFSVPKETWTIRGDPTQIHQVFLNLCVNARDAMPSGGSLTIKVENSVLDKQYAAMNLEVKPGRYVLISVTDSGSGISPHLVEKIFEPFFTTKELTKGTGLGLSTVQAIIKSHEGVINVYSELGKGTTFKVYLPAMDSPAEAQERLTQEIMVPRGKGETVMVIDDEPSILAITSQTLQAFGYRVLTATDGAEAAAIYAEHRQEVAVVLVDMVMPIMDGPALISVLTRMNPKVKIIAASGFTTNADSVRTFSNVRHFIVKPYTASMLLRLIRTILDED